MSRMYERALELADELPSDERAKLAGAILTGVNPTLTNLKAFWDELDEGVRGELSGRVEQWTGPDATG